MLKFVISFRPTRFYWVFEYLSKLGLKLIYVSLFVSNIIKTGAGFSGRDNQYNVDAI